MTIAEQLRAARDRRGLSQAQLAKEANVSCSVISKIEQGIRRQPRPTTLVRIADALGVPVRELMGA